ncbi:TPA: hypothetical protein L9K46_002518 [Klebsiella pneumoniae]|nr:hypothetical protein [Klebsiella pneumoniae]HBR0986951.1 hypothetical protein [Klebsiella pneumoniae]
MSRSDGYKNDAPAINDALKYYDADGWLIVGANLIGKIHPQLFGKLVRRADDGSNRSQQACITAYLEEVLANV